VVPKLDVAMTEVFTFFKVLIAPNKDYHTKLMSIFHPDLVWHLVQIEPCTCCTLAGCISQIFTVTRFQKQVCFVFGLFMRGSRSPA